MRERTGGVSRRPISTNLTRNTYMSRTFTSILQELATVVRADPGITTAELADRLRLPYHFVRPMRQAVTGAPARHYRKRRSVRTTNVIQLELPFEDAAE
jgi:hypothetical protein